MPTAIDGRVLVAMSGGVDSSVAAFLLSKEGYCCEGTTMRLYRTTELGVKSLRTCCTQSDINDAAQVAADIGIPFEVTEMTADFRSCVIDRFAQVYLSGGTPNPCIDCNSYMKFDRLLVLAIERGFDYIATGHYAQVIYDESTGKYLLKKGLDQSKDQSYVLYMLGQEQLSHLLLPLGGLHKTEVRAIAEEQGFVNARKRDSQDICFVPDGDYARFLEHHTGRHFEEGDLLDTAGNVIGKHKGAVRYTVGQRKGIGYSSDRPLYVVSKDMEKNTVTLGEERELYSGTLYAEEVNWICGEPSAPLRVTAMTRYRSRLCPATVYPEGEGFKLKFDEPQRAVTPGQAVVLYDGDTVLGGGTISKTEK